MPDLFTPEFFFCDGPDTVFELLWSWAGRSDP